MRNLFVLLVLFVISACSSTDVKLKTIPELEKYGEECYHKPYTENRDNQSLCMTSAIAKHHAQVNLINSN